MAYIQAFGPTGLNPGTFQSAWDASPRSGTIHVRQVTGGSRHVQVVIDAADYIDGQRDLKWVSVYGTVDKWGDPRIGATAVGTIPFAPVINVVLSATDAVMELHADLRYASGRSVTIEPAEFDFAPPWKPEVTIFRRERVYPAYAYAVGTANFRWGVSTAATEYQVTLAPTDRAAYEECVPILDTGLSANLSGGTLAAGASVLTDITQADFITAQKALRGQGDQGTALGSQWSDLIKVFYKDTASGLWTD